MLIIRITIGSINTCGKQLSPRLKASSYCSQLLLFNEIHLSYAWSLCQVEHPIRYVRTVQ
jgi:hypothetical protein